MISKNMVVDQLNCQIANEQIKRNNKKRQAELQYIYLKGKRTLHVEV